MGAYPGNIPAEPDIHRKILADPERKEILVAIAAAAILVPVQRSPGLLDLAGSVLYVLAWFGSENPLGPFVVRLGF